jgi:hypothetical protein
MQFHRFIIVTGACVWSACTGSDGAPANSTGSEGTTGGAGTTGNDATTGSAGIAAHLSLALTP